MNKYFTTHTSYNMLFAVRFTYANTRGISQIRSTIKEMVD